MHSSLSFDLRSLEVFLATCSLRSMTAAAERLAMTQSAVSQTIGQLERALGQKLLDRRTRPLGITAAGEVLRHGAAEIVQAAQMIPGAMRQLEAGEPARLRIGLVDSLSSPFVPELLIRLKGTLRYFSVTAGLAAGLREGLLDYTLDIVITNDPMEDLDGLLRETVLVEPYLVVVPARLELAGEKLDLERLARDLPLVRWSARSHIGTEVERHLRRLRLAIPRQLEFDSADALLGIVGANLGWAVMTPLCIMNASARLGAVRTLPFPGPGFTRRLSLIAREGELGAVAGRVAKLSRIILRERYVPQMARLAPWLAREVRVTA